MLGSPDPEAVRRLLAASPGLTLLVDTPRLRAWAGTGLTGWRAGERQGWTWASPAPEVRPTGWESAARDAHAPGIEVGPERGVVHADGLALQDVYARRLGDAVYLSTRITPLLGLDESALTVDLAAWAAMLVIGAPVGSATPVTQVRRLTAGAAWTVSPDGRLDQRVATPPWEDLPERPPTPAEMTDLVAEAIPHGPEPVVVTLSGGWDSRVLASLSLRRGHAVEAWTTYQFHPREKDLVWAQRVAEALALPQRMVVPSGRDWATHQASARRRVEFQTWMHTWLFAIAETLRTQALPVVDGGYGDALLRADIAGRAAASGVPWPQLQYARSGGKRLEFVAPAVASVLGDAVAASFDEVAAPVADHPNRITLLQLLTRQNRAVTAAPRLLVGPETEVWMPFTHPRVFRGAIAVPLADKQHHAYYLEMLRTSCGPERDIRSTNDRGSLAQKKAGSFLPSALVAALMGQVRESERATALLGPLLSEALLAQDGAESLRRRLRPADVLAWAAMLADFEHEYAGRLDWSGWPG